VESAGVTKHAARGPVRLSVSIDRSEVKVPDTLSLALTAQAETGVDVQWPEIGDFLGEFAVSARREEPPTTQDAATQTMRRTLTLESFIPGQLEIPEITVRFVDRREKADGSSEPYEDHVAVGPIAVTVHAGLADVKGPLGVPWSRTYAWLAWTLAAIALVVLAAGLCWRWYGRRSGRSRGRPPVVVPAHVWALAELDILASESLVERGRIKEFYYRINAIVRGYIERRFALMAGEQTSEEFVRSMGQSRFLSEPHKEVLRRFVAACDPVKYARQLPEPGEIAWVQSAARDFVLQTAQLTPEPSDAVFVAAREGGS